MCFNAGIGIQSAAFELSFLNLHLRRGELFLLASTQSSVFIFCSDCSAKSGRTSVSEEQRCLASPSAAIKLLGRVRPNCSKTCVSKLRHSLKCLFLLGQAGLSAAIICAIAVRFRDSCATKGTKCTQLSGSFPNAENLSNVSTYACFLNVGCSEVILRLTLCSAFFCLSKLCIVYAALLSFEKGRMRKDDASALFEIALRYAAFLHVFLQEWTNGRCENIAMFWLVSIPGDAFLLLTSLF